MIKTYKEQTEILQKVNSKVISEFGLEVQSGLNDRPKSLPSKYFYDKIGDALFVEIMNLPEYYLTRCELDVFQNKSGQLIDAFQLNGNDYFELIELGAGDGLKTKELLKCLVGSDFKFDYFPIDISSNALDLLKADLQTALPKVSVKTKQGDYFKVLDALKQSKQPKIILFLGSNIGNMPDEVAIQFMYNLSANLNRGDKLILGVDLIKSQKVVLPAYHDSSGITAKFNLNLLERINNELGADFNLSQFKHHPEYDEKVGIAKSFIESTANQTVTIKALDKTYNFVKGEKIQTEISRKYNDEILETIIADTDFKIDSKILDAKGYFADYILTKQ